MIAVNLLPVELRRQERTPLPRQLVIYGSVGVNFIALMILLTLHVSSIPGAVSENGSLKAHIDKMTVIDKIPSQHSALLADRTDFETRKTTIGKIEAERVIWAKKLDQLWDLKPNSIWFASVELKEPETPKTSGRNKKKATPIGSRLIITGYVGGSNIDEVSRFIQALQKPGEEGKAAFFDDFVKVYDPVLERDEKTFSEYNNAVVTKFTLTLEMKLRGEQVEAAKKKAVAQAAAPKRL